MRERGGEEGLRHAQEKGERKLRAHEGIHTSVVVIGFQLLLVSRGKTRVRVSAFSGSSLKLVFGMGYQE